MRTPSSNPPMPAQRARPFTTAFPGRSRRASGSPRALSAPLAPRPPPAAACPPPWEGASSPRRRGRPRVGARGASGARGPSPSPPGFHAPLGLLPHLLHEDVDTRGQEGGEHHQAEREEAHLARRHRLPLARAQRESPRLATSRSGYAARISFILGAWLRAEAYSAIRAHSPGRSLSSATRAASARRRGKGRLPPRGGAGGSGPHSGAFRITGRLLRRRGQTSGVPSPRPRSRLAVSTPRPGRIPGTPAKETRRP